MPHSQGSRNPKNLSVILECQRDFLIDSRSVLESTRSKSDHLESPAFLEAATSDSHLLDSKYNTESNVINSPANSKSILESSLSKSTPSVIASLSNSKAVHKNTSISKLEVKTQSIPLQNLDSKNHSKLVTTDSTSTPNSPKEPPTIITAYYKLDLAAQSKKSYKASRTTQTYLNFFRFWAGVPNTFIIYTSEDIESEIYAMREQHGLRDKTIVVRKELESFDAQALDSIRKVFSDFDQASARFDPEHPPHTSPEYNYLMYCKSFCVCDALSNPLTQGQNLEQILWLDFGYNLGGNTYTKSEEFDFYFTPQDEFIAELRAHNAWDKLCFFGLGAPDRRALAHILISGTAHFLTGCCMYGSKQAWLKFNAYMQEALRAFISFGIMDDDQKLSIWCVQNYPQDFHILPLDDWFNALYYFMPESKRKNISTTRPSLLQESLDSEVITKRLGYDVEAQNVGENALKNDELQSEQSVKQKSMSLFKRIAKWLKQRVKVQ